MLTKVTPRPCRWRAQTLAFLSASRAVCVRARTAGVLAVLGLYHAGAGAQADSSGLKPLEGQPVVAADASFTLAPPAETGSDWLFMLVGGAVLLVVVLAVAVMWYARRTGGASRTVHTFRGEEAGQAGFGKRPEARLIDKAGVVGVGEIAISEDVVIIGRSKQNSSAGVQGVVLPIATVGRRHACIEYRSHAFYVSDLASVNGTMVNGNRVDEPTILHNGDVIGIESLELTFALPMESQGEETQFVPERGVDEQVEAMMATHAVMTPPAQPATGGGGMIAKLSAELEVDEPEEAATELLEDAVPAVPAAASITVAPGFEPASEQKAAVDAEAQDGDRDITLTEAMTPAAPPPKSPARASDTHDSLVASLADAPDDDEERTTGDGLTAPLPAPGPVVPAPVQPAAPAMESTPESLQPPVLDDMEAPTSLILDQPQGEEEATADTESASVAAQEQGDAFPLLVDEVPAPVDARAFADTTLDDENARDPGVTADDWDPDAPASEADVPTGPADRVDDLIRAIEKSVPAPVLDLRDTSDDDAARGGDLQAGDVAASANLPPVVPDAQAQPPRPAPPEPEQSTPPPRPAAPPPPAPPTRAPVSPPPPASPPVSPPPASVAPQDRPQRQAADMPPAFLIDLDGITSTPHFQLLADTVSVGRSQPTPANEKTYLSIRRNTVGRKHASVRYARGHFWVEDHKSVNGTFVNGERVDGMTPLENGDEVTFDTYRFSFVVANEGDDLDPELDLDKTQFRGG